MNQESNTTSETPEHTLSSDDARIVDALIESMGAQARAQAHGGVEEVTPAAFVKPGDAERARRVAAWLALIAQCPAETPSLDLAQRTMERVADARRKEWFAEQAQALAAPRVGMGWNDIGALAAIVLIAASLVVPMLGQVRSDARKLACSEGLNQAGIAMAGYGVDNNDRMPRRAVQPGSVWWNVGQPQQQAKKDTPMPIESNSAHLYQLVRGGYIAPEGLNCPENSFAPRLMTRDMQDWKRPQDVSYSYQNQYSPKAIRLSAAPSMAALADKNPLFTPRADQKLGLEYRNDLAPKTASNFHSGRGQNILLLDGRVLWSLDPTLPNGDNIWLLNKKTTNYKGNEVPDEPNDSFLVP